MMMMMMNQTFNFRATDDRTKIQEKLWGCKMSNEDKEFYRLQCQNPSTRILFDIKCQCSVRTWND